MTKKDFIAIAKVLKYNKASPVLISEMAKMLAGTNPAFDLERFVKACQQG